MSRSHSSLQLCLEYYLYEYATVVKLVLFASDQSKIKDGDVHITFWHDKSSIELWVL